MQKIVVLISIFLLFGLELYGSFIWGNNPGYANKEIIFYEQADPFTGSHKVVGNAKVDSTGNFEIEVDVKETTYIYAFPGVYLIYLFVEPGEDYEIILPEFIEKKQADRLNPFFKTVNVHLGTKEFSEDDLNVQIRMFLDSYIPYYNKHIDKVFTDKDFEQLDKDIGKMEKAFSRSKNVFFNQYREYKYGMLRFLAYQHKSKAISNQYFKNKPVLYKNPAYMELFNMVYKKYFTHFSRADEEKLLSKSISEHKSYKKLKEALKRDEVIQPDELLNMVALKCLHDEFYDDNYSRADMLTILDSFIENTQFTKQKEIAVGIREKVTRLLIGFNPPGFSLYDSDSNLVTLDNFKGKFVYLNFCSCFSYSCLNEFAMLQKLYEKHNKYLEIVSVIVDEDVTVMKDFVQRSGYTWKFLHYDNHPEILAEYDIRIYPTYYLVDHEGKLVMSPASTPNEAFEGRLFKLLRAKGIL